MGINTDNAELVGTREFYKDFAKQMNRLTDEDIDKIVLTRRGQMIGVVLTPEKYEALIEERGGRV